MIFIIIQPQFFFLAASLAALSLFSLAMLALVFEMNPSIPNNPIIRTKAGSLNR